MPTSPADTFSGQTVGITLMTQLRADTSLPVFWLWMFITGVGIGPTLSVFTIVVQTAVPFNKLGVATSNLRYLAALLDLYLVVPVYSTVKATYLLGLTPVLGPLFVAGVRPILRFRPLRAGVVGAIFAWAAAAFAAYFVL